MALNWTSTISPTLVNERSSATAFSSPTSSRLDQRLLPSRHRDHHSAAVPPGQRALRHHSRARAFGGITNQSTGSVSINGSPFFQQIPSYNVTDNLTKILRQAYHQDWVSTTIKRPHSILPSRPLRLPWTTRPAWAPTRTSRSIRAIRSPTRCSASSTAIRRPVRRWPRIPFTTRWKDTSRIHGALRRHLTLDYGLRFSYLGPVHDLSQQEEYLRAQLVEPGSGGATLHSGFGKRHRARCRSGEHSHQPHDRRHAADQLSGTDRARFRQSHQRSGFREELSHHGRIHAGRSRGPAFRLRVAAAQRNGGSRRLRHLLRPRPDRLRQQRSAVPAQRSDARALLWFAQQHQLDHGQRSSRNNRPDGRLAERQYALRQ